jgi:hypothetical protein
MARLDRVKNLSGLVELFAKSDRLRKVANLVFVGGVIDPEKSGDRWGNPWSTLLQTCKQACAYMCRVVATSMLSSNPAMDAHLMVICVGRRRTSVSWCTN